MALDDVAADMPWLHDMATNLLQQQFEAWKEHKKMTSSHAWKVLHEESGLWVTPETQDIDPEDPRIASGKLVDLLQCTMATEQPSQFFETSLNTIVILLPHIIEADWSNEEMCEIIHSIWVDANQHEEHLRPDLFKPFKDLSRQDQEKDYDFLFLIRQYILDHLEELPVDFVTDESAAVIGQQHVSFEDFSVEK